MRKLSESCEEVIRKQQTDIVANKKRLNGPEGQFSKELVLHKSVLACIFNSNICCLSSGQLAKYNQLQYSYDLITQTAAVYSADRQTVYLVR